MRGGNSVLGEYIVRAAIASIPCWEQLAYRLHKPSGKSRTKQRDQST